MFLPIHTEVSDVMDYVCCTLSRNPVLWTCRRGLVWSRHGGFGPLGHSGPLCVICECWELPGACFLFSDPALPYLKVFVSIPRSYALD